MANGIPAVRRIQKFRNGGDYSFLDRALDTPLGPGSPNTLRDVPAMARSLGPGFLELARYQPTGVGDVAEAAHFASSLRDPEYRGELVDLSKVSTDPALCRWFRCRVLPHGMVLRIDLNASGLHRSAQVKGLKPMGMDCILLRTLKLGSGIGNGCRPTSASIPLSMLGIGQ